MPLQKSAALRNAQNDQWEVIIGASARLRIATGAAPVDTATADAGTVLIVIVLPVDWMGASAAGAMAKAGTWSGAATATGTPGHFRIKNNADTITGVQGTAAVGSGDLNFDGSITSGQTITITTFTVTAGGA